MQKYFIFYKRFKISLSYHQHFTAYVIISLQAKNGPCKCAANKNINTSAIGVQSLKNFNICRCGSFSTKHRNTIKDLVKIKQHHQDTIQEAASEIYKK